MSDRHHDGPFRAISCTYKYPVELESKNIAQSQASKKIRFSKFECQLGCTVLQYSIKLEIQWAEIDSVFRIYRSVDVAQI